MDRHDLRQPLRRVQLGEVDDGQCLGRVPPRTGDQPAYLPLRQRFAATDQLNRVAPVMRGDDPAITSCTSAVNIYPDTFTALPRDTSRLLRPPDGGGRVRDR